MAYIEKELGKEIIRVIYSSALTSQIDVYFINKERPLFKIYRSFIEEAFSKGKIRTNLSIDELTTILIQSSMGSIYLWCLGDVKSLEESSVKLFNTLIDGLRS